MAMLVPLLFAHRTQCVDLLACYRHAVPPPTINLTLDFSRTFAYAAFRGDYRSAYGEGDPASATHFRMTIIVAAAMPRGFLSPHLPLDSN